MLKESNFIKLLKQYRFIFVHAVLWVIFLCIPFSQVMFSRHLDYFHLLILFYTLLVCYLNYYLLVPKLLLKKHTTYYFISIFLVLILFLTILNFYSKSLIVETIKSGIMIPHEMVVQMKEKPFLMVFPNVVLMILLVSLSSMFRIYVEWNTTFQLQKITETEKKTSELNFLKAQLNPHFFFNSLNTVFSLSIKKSEKTSESILNLSELMRYMIYETNKDKVRLQDEIFYLENYIELQKLRLTPNNNVIFEIIGDTKSINVPPLLFISFIENAFKYGVSPAKQNKIIIQFTISPSEINMTTINPINIENKDENASGLGIENTVKRINLYFPNRNTLNTFIQNNNYHVELNLKLDEN